MNKRAQLQLKRRERKIVMVDAAGNERVLTIVQAEHLGRRLISEAKRMKRAHRLRRLVPIRLPGGK